LIVGLIIVIVPAAAHGDSAPQRSRIRALDEAVSTLLRVGYRHSPTFRRLVHALERSDVITHLETGRTEQYGTAGATKFAGRSGGHRYLRIVVTASQRPQSASVAVLGHELYHALEVAEARWVVDQASYQNLYQRIGYPSCGPRLLRCYDTRAASEIGLKILGEFWGR
jgi:hypothetical protein